ncbi:MAG: phenazine biosynthesis protein PhzF family protein [Osedax symbiont Rs2]|nr:MAG: phenazine biosynthesis protein PhzF family protein [Osedax symbiont Rs2]
MSIEVATVNAFTYNNTGGTPAGVVLAADALNTEQMQHIATQMGLSETAFVLTSAQADFEVRFFTPNAEVDFCGHATVAVFHLLYLQKVLTPGSYSQLTKAGQLEVTIAADGSVVMQQQLPTFLQRFTALEIAPMLGISPSVITDTGLPITAISTGLVDLMVPVSSGSLDSVIANQPLIAEFSRQQQLVGLHLFELSAVNSGFSASCRNFAPAFAIDEESATGSASGALACYLATYHDQRATDFVFEQGKKMGACSRLSASVEKQANAISSVRVGGQGQFIDSFSIKF